MKYILHSKWRGSALIVSIIFLSLSGLLISKLVVPQAIKRLVATPAATAPIRSAVYVNGGFSFSPPQQLQRVGIPLTPLVSFKDQDAEPEIKIDIYGNIYITGIHGVPGGVDLWKSTDNGATFTYLGEPDGAQDHCDVEGTLPCVGGAGGGDDSIDVSTGGYLYVTSLSLAGITMSVSTDGGVGGVEPGQKWEVNPASSGIPVNDRQWMAAYGPQTVYMTFDQAPAPGPLWFVKSTDAGKTFSSPVMLTPAGGVNRPGNVAVDQYTGNIYTVYEPRTLLGAGVPNQINLLKSTDGGTNWTTTTAYTGPAGTTVENAFVILAVDRGGNLHMVFAQSSVGTHRTNCHVYLMSSSDGGGTWTTPVQVDSGAGNNSALMPWVVGGSPGVVDITWYGSTMASPDDVPNANPAVGQWWNVFFAQVTNATSANPTIAQSQVASNVHNDAICSSGGNCTGSTRDLTEYYTMTIDGAGNAHIAYEDGVNNCVGPPASNCYVKTWYTKQTAGSSALIPVTGPAPATFGPNISLGSPGGEPGLKVDSHNCIFVTAPGGASMWKSVNNGASFLPKVNPVAAYTPTGGDEDILSIPQNNGARPDILYFADLASLTNINIAKSIDGGATWIMPGPGGAAGHVDASSDRQWIATDRGVPTAADFTVYEMDHEAAAEAIRFNALTVTGGTTDGVWSPPSSGMTDPELILPPTSTFPNTNPGPVFTDPATHKVYGVFTASVLRTNRANPPFGKLPNVWAAVGDAPTAAGAPPGTYNPSTAQFEMTNHPIFKGVQDSPDLLPAPAPTPNPAAKTFGNNTANDFPSAAIDSGGNIYVVWAMNNARTNEYMVWFASSHDHGKTYYGPFQVSQGPGAAVMPWIAAGDTGRVDIVYYSTTTAVDPNVAPNSVEWNTFFAQSLNANAREPAFTRSQMSDHINHKGPICNMGLLCPSGTRTLADFFQVAIGPDGLANVSFADNGLTSLHTEFARQTGGPLATTNPQSVTCLVGPSIVPVSAVSRKTHAAAGDFDLDLPVVGTPGVECRSGGANGDHKVLISFANAVSVGGVSVGSADGQAMVSGFTVNGPVVTVNLTHVNNRQTIVITLTNVSDGTNLGNATLSMGVLFGDVNGVAGVTGSDVNICKSQVGIDLNSDNFRNDVNLTGFVSGSDVNEIKAHVGEFLFSPGD